MKIHGHVGTNTSITSDVCQGCSSSLISLVLLGPTQFVLCVHLSFLVLCRRFGGLKVPLLASRPAWARACIPDTRRWHRPHGQQTRQLTTNPRTPRSVLHCFRHKPWNESSIFSATADSCNRGQPPLMRYAFTVVGAASWKLLTFRYLDYEVLLQRQYGGDMPVAHHSLDYSARRHEQQ